MSSGKTQASINYINKHPEKRFVYITPYLEEAARIKKGCPAARFAEPSNKIKEYHFAKIEHTEKLLNEGRNIATTHQAFRMYDEDMLQVIRAQHYTLIIDENVELLENYKCSQSDVDMAIECGYINENNGLLSLTDKEYTGEFFKNMFNVMRDNQLIRVSDKETADLFYWVLQPELVQAFEDVFVLTYMFDGQSIKHYFDIYNMEYSFIGIHKIKDMEYEFTDGIGDVPEYIADLKDKIHIMHRDKFNKVGDDYYALSSTWFKKYPGKVDKLKHNIRNFYRTHIPDSIASNQLLWSTFLDGKQVLSAKGYTTSFLPFNTKATNDYINRKALVYAVNIFMHVGESMFYRAYGINVDQDAYALSIMIQWIWRSAIRNGEEIWIYIPSRRMRNLLEGWIDRLSKGETA